jgi:hypothetical protein
VGVGRYIVGSFVGGTVLCAGVFGGAWLYTMYTLDVKDSKEYADKMRQLTPGTKEAMQHGFLGTAVHSFKSSTIEWLETKDSFRRFKRVMRAGLLSSCLSLVAMLCSCALSAMCAPLVLVCYVHTYQDRVPSRAKLCRASTVAKL